MSQQPSGRGPRVTFEGTGTRQVRPTAVGRGTHGVPDVRRIVESQFHIAFPHRVWVSGEVGTPYAADDGLRFALHPSTGEDPFSLPCRVPDEGLATVRELLHRTHDADLEDVVREGRLARVGGLLRFDAARGAIVLLVSELDPTPTALELEDARRAALSQVAEGRLAERQRARSVRTAPLEVAVVAAPDEAERARELLAASRYDVDLHVLPVALTGRDAPTVLADAVRQAGTSADVVLLLRRQGRPLGLATYDALEVAEAVADSPVPVVTGLGGGEVRTASDEVAWAALPAAPEALGWLLQRLEDAEHTLEDLVAEVSDGVQEAAERCRTTLATLRAEVDEAAVRAAERAERVRRRRRLALRLACAVLAVAVVVAAVVLGVELLLLALLVPLLVLVGTELWWRSPTSGRPTTRRTAMSARDDDFTQVLSRLRAVRDELQTTTSPERVAVLRDLATGLAADGERLLGVHLTPGAADPLPAADEAAPLAGGADGAAAPSTPPSARSGQAGGAAGSSGDVAATRPASVRAEPVDTEETRPLDAEETRPVDAAATRPVDAGATRTVDAEQTRPVDTQQNRPVDAGTTRPVDAGTTGSDEVAERTRPVDLQHTSETARAEPGGRSGADDQDRTSVLLRPESPDRR